MRKNARFFTLVGAGALGLRLFLVLCFPGVMDDSRLYANIAKNWLQYGVYGITDSGQVVPTLARLPGYPAFLAAIFALFGGDNFRAVLLAQMFFDLATCFLIADLARRLFSERSAKAAFALAAFCPFLANYAAAVLTETLEIFFTVLALDLAIRGLGVGDPQERRPSTLLWLGCGLSAGACILLRPDGGILAAAVGGYLLVLLFRSLRSQPEGSHPARRPGALVRAGVLLTIGAVTPLVPWTLRNLHTLHRFQPLAPRYANDAADPVLSGFNRWVKTWIVDYVSVQEIYWQVPGSGFDAARLPARAFDSAQEREETTALIAEYNEDHDMSAELDTRFAALAAARVRNHPLRYYVWLPAVRIADMWVRPRTELFPSDPRWWEFNDDGRWLAVSLVFGVVNLLYLGMAAGGLPRTRAIFGVGLFVLFLLLRSLFLGTLENPEPRYTLECYPVAILLGSALFRC